MAAIIAQRCPEASSGTPLSVWAGSSNRGTVGFEFVDHSNILAFAPGAWPLLQYFPFMPDFDPSSVPMGVDEEVGDTPASTIKAARKIERRGRPLPQLEQGVGDAWILIAFIVALGLIFVVAAWVLAGSDVPAERESNGQGIIASSTPPEFVRVHVEKGGLTHD